MGKTEKEVKKEIVEEQKEIAITNPMEDEKLLRHVVIFKFNDDAPEAEVEKINKSFGELQNHIPVIQDFEWGLNDSPEDFHQGFTHCYFLTFKSEEDRDSIYTPHPKHQEFVASLQPYLEKVFVVDYWAN
ncbi:Dabb family protein [Muricauda sp. DJ-13]|uniref:Dabb family protein n=2 Tax=Croceivirga thetidis TaxID=2721623 RepID=A0ABX1GNE8_9FLAO|nr:Dabb family protein [Croceivirga thetidis]